MPKLILSKSLIGLTFGTSRGPIRECAFVYLAPWTYSAGCPWRVRVFGNFIASIV